MSRPWDFTFDQHDTAEAIDSAGKLVAGWYKAKFTKVEDNKKDGSAEMEFTVIGGPYEGQVAEKKMWNPQFAPDEKKARNAKHLGSAVAKRLGLLSDADIAAKKPLSRPWSDALGREVVIQVTMRMWKKKDDNGKETGEVIPIAEVAYLGIFPFDHPDIPANIRTELNLGPARARTAGDGAAAGGKGNGASAAAGGAGGAAAPATASFDASFWEGQAKEILK